MGVHIDRTIALTFVLGGLMGGAAGFLFGLQFGVIYTMGFVPGLKAFTAAVLGGIGNIRGAMDPAVSCWESSRAFRCAGCPPSGGRRRLACLMLLLFRPTAILGERLGEGRV